MGCLFLIKVTSRVAKGKDKLAVSNTENRLLGRRYNSHFDFLGGGTILMVPLPCFVRNPTVTAFFWR